MTLNLTIPQTMHTDFSPRITVMFLSSIRGVDTRLQYRMRESLSRIAYAEFVSWLTLN